MDCQNYYLPSVLRFLNSRLAQTVLENHKLATHSATHHIRVCSKAWSRQWVEMSRQTTPHGQHLPAFKQIVTTVRPYFVPCTRPQSI